MKNKPDGPPNKETKPKKTQQKTMTTPILQSSQMALAMKPAGSDVRASKCAPKSPWGGNRGAVLWRSGAQVWKAIECTADSKGFLSFFFFLSMHLVQQSSNKCSTYVETRNFALATLFLLVLVAGMHLCNICYTIGKPCYFLWIWCHTFVWHHFFCVVSSRFVVWLFSGRPAQSRWLVAG